MQIVKVTGVEGEGITEWAMAHPGYMLRKAISSFWFFESLSLIMKTNHFLRRIDKLLYFDYFCITTLKRLFFTIDISKKCKLPS